MRWCLHRSLPHCSCIQQNRLRLTCARKCLHSYLRQKCHHRRGTTMNFQLNYALLSERGLISDSTLSFITCRTNSVNRMCTGVINHSPLVLREPRNDEDSEIDTRACTANTFTSARNSMKYTMSLTLSISTPGIRLCT